MILRIQGETLDIVCRVIKRLMELQNRVQDLLIFFKAIGNSVEKLAEIHNREFMEQTELQVECGETESDTTDYLHLRENTLQTAALVKQEFTIIPKIAQAYVEVSSKHIIPGFMIVDRLGLSATSLSEEDRNQKLNELDDYKRNTSESVAEIMERVCCPLLVVVICNR